MFLSVSSNCDLPRVLGDGFVGNRMLAPYAGEAKMLVEEGATIEQIDKAKSGNRVVVCFLRVPSLR